MLDSTLKCNVSHGNPNKTNGIKVFLLIAPDRFVAKNHNNAEDATAVSSFVEGGAVELRIKTTGGNKSEFQYKQPHYLRIAAQAAHCDIVPEWTEMVSTDEFDMEAYTAAGAPEDWWNYFVKVEVVHPTEFASDGTVNPNQVYNYSPVWKVSEDFGTFTEVTDWD